MKLHPYRSVIYIPADSARFLEKARALPCDAIIFDFEDAVAPAQKEAARDTLAVALKEGGFAPRTQIIRINDLDTPWGRDDVQMMHKSKPAYLLLPKVNSAQDIHDLEAEMGKYEGYENTKIWAMMETPQAILNAGEIANATPNMAGLVLGTNDLAKDLGLRVGPARAELQTALSLSVLAAKAAGIAVVDGVYNAFKDDAGLRNEAVQGRDMGFDGKTLIHPAQIEGANEVFTPSQEELDLAKRQIAAYDEALENGTGIAVVDGKIVENLHVETARALIAKMEKIEQIRSSF